MDWEEFKNTFKFVSAVELYQSSEAGHLSFAPNDNIEVLDSNQSGWWRGRCNGREGYFPSSFVVKTLQEQEEELAEKQAQDRKLYAKRTNIVNELLDTEKTYVDNLKLLSKEYKSPLIALCKEKHIITETAVATIFSNIDLITELHVQLLAELEKVRGVSPETTKIGNIFVTMAPFMKLYTQYVNNYDNALNTISALHKNKKFVAFLQSRPTPLERIKGDWYLTHLLILPVQRIPRYLLFLQQLVEATPKSHDDFNNLKKGLEMVATLADHIEKTKTKFENRQKMWTIHNRLQYRKKGSNRARYHHKKLLNLMKPSRQLLREGQVKALCEGQVADCMLFLFNDSVLLTKIVLRGEELEYIQMAGLANAKCVRASQEFIGSDLRPLKVMSTEKAYCVELVFYAESSTQLDDWERAVTQQITIYSENQRTLAEATPFHKACEAGDLASARLSLHNIDPALRQELLNSKDHKGRTPIYLAAKRGHTSVAQYLCEELKVDPCIAAENGLLPSQAARSYGFKQVAEYLRIKEQEGCSSYSSTGYDSSEDGVPAIMKDSGSLSRALGKKFKNSQWFPYHGSGGGSDGYGSGGGGKEKSPRNKDACSQSGVVGVFRRGGSKEDLKRPDSGKCKKEKDEKRSSKKGFIAFARRGKRSKEKVTRRSASLADLRSLQEDESLDTNAHNRNSRDEIQKQQQLQQQGGASTPTMEQRSPFYINCSESQTFRVRAHTNSPSSSSRTNTPQILGQARSLPCSPREASSSSSSATSVPPIASPLFFEPLNLSAVSSSSSSPSSSSPSSPTSSYSSASSTFGSAPALLSPRRVPRSPRTFPSPSPSSPSSSSSNIILNNNNGGSYIGGGSDSPRGRAAVVLMDYNGRDESELTLRKNDIVFLRERRENGMWEGVCKGRCGLFPLIHVKLQEPFPQQQQPQDLHT
ncbi:Rho guanyl-nucleotide exchange factor [Balamuthia mandrillaris]